MRKPQEPEVPVNVFALPNQTTILFVLIMVVILVTVFWGSSISSPICIWPLALGLLALPLRAVLKRPEREIRCHDLSPAGEDFSILKQYIAARAKALALPRTPVLLVSPGGMPIYTFGSFRHWYIAMDQKTAQTMQTHLTDPDNTLVVEAQLVHELYHFKTGDHWQLGYTGELLRTNFTLMAWAAMFFLGFGLFLIVAIRSLLDLDIQAMISQMAAIPELGVTLSDIFPSPEQVAAVQESAAQINLGLVINFALSITWPFVVVGFVIWIIYWPRLWRLRELYADAGMIYYQGRMMPALAVLTRLPLSDLKDKIDTVQGSWQVSKRLKRLHRGNNSRKAAGVFGFVASKFPGEYHPSSFARLATLFDPGLVFHSWKESAVLIGGLVLLLEFLLMTPLTLLQLGKWPMHFTTLATVCLIAFNFLIPTIARGKSARVDLLKMVGLIGGIRLLLILAILCLLVVMLIAVPDVLYEVLCYAVAGAAGYAGYSTAVCIDDLEGFVMEAATKNLAQAILMPILIVVMLMLIHFLITRTLTWYGFPDAGRRLIKVIYACIVGVGLFGAMTVLPFFTDLILRPVEIMNVSTLVVEALGLFVAITGSVFYLYADRKYAQRCPECGAIVPGVFSPGRRCCGKILHPWLITERKL